MRANGRTRMFAFGAVTLVGPVPALISGDMTVAVTPKKRTKGAAVVTLKLLLPSAAMDASEQVNVNGSETFGCVHSPPLLNAAAAMGAVNTSVTVGATAFGPPLVTFMVKVAGFPTCTGSGVTLWLAAMLKSAVPTAVVTFKVIAIGDVVVPEVPNRLKA